MGQLTESQYKIIADRMIEEHRKYGDRLRPGHWADVAARKVVSHMDDFREEERTYTASEVRAILEHMLDDAVFMNGRYHDRFDKITHIAKTHGITLDPA